MADEFEQAPGVGDGQGRLASYSPWGRKELDTTKWLNWTELIYGWYLLALKFTFPGSMCYFSGDLSILALYSEITSRQLSCWLIWLHVPVTWILTGHFFCLCLGNQSFNMTLSFQDPSHIRTYPVLCSVPMQWVRPVSTDRYPFTTKCHLTWIHHWPLPR